MWRHLKNLAGLAARGGPWWCLVRPPLAFEVYADATGVSAGLWLPGWVPLTAVEREIGRAWPGATVSVTDPPTVDGAGTAGTVVAGVRLAADSLHPETGWLVDDPRPRTATRRGVGTDPDLTAVFSALTDPGGEHAAWLLLQILILPAPGRRVARLAAAAKHPIAARRTGVQAGADGLVWLLQAGIHALLAVVDVFLSAGSSRSTSARSSSSRTNAGRQVPDPIEREAMAEARAKHNDGPHVLASLRMFAAGGTRSAARAAARSVAAGFGEASRSLRPVRLGRARTRAGLRRAGRGEWLLLSAAELGVLAHLPPDPALYRFDTIALHRPQPGQARRADPEADWTRRGWATGRERPAHGGADRADTDDYDADDYDTDFAEAE